MDRLSMAKQIVDWEARRDAAGRLKVYALPPNDGGGAYEVAGINEKYDRAMASELKLLVEHGRYDEAESKAAEYIARMTDGAANWASLPAAQLFLRSVIFNRGPTGAAKILQLAVRTDPDGSVGPITRAAVAEAEKKPIHFLARLRVARADYERLYVGLRSNLQRGLENRWDNELSAALDLMMV